MLRPLFSAPDLYSRRLLCQSLHAYEFLAELCLLSAFVLVKLFCFWEKSVAGARGLPEAHADGGPEQLHTHKALGLGAES
jgi:hypothetical protein